MSATDGERNALRFFVLTKIYNNIILIFFNFYGGVSAIKGNNSKEYLINEEIGKELKLAPNKTLRVVGPDGEQLGLVPYSSALNNAFDKGLDLVLIAQQADPPVCRIMDYGRFKFERDKKDKEANKKQQIIEIKEIQLSCRIDVNDFNTKGNHARRFLAEGNKVKVIVKFRGRQMSHLEFGRDLLVKFAEFCAETGTVDKAPLLEGRSMIMFLAPIKTVQTKSAKKQANTVESAESGEKTETSAEAEN